MNSPARLNKGAVIGRHAFRKSRILRRVEGGVDKLGDETHGWNKIIRRKICLALKVDRLRLT